MKKKKLTSEKKLKYFNILISRPMMAAAMGFGVFWIYRLNEMDVFLSIFVALYLTALSNYVLNVEAKNE